MNRRQKENRNRRIMQMIFGSQLFSYFSTYKIRIWAYRKCYNIGDGVRIMEGVVFSRKHSQEGSLIIGKNVLLGRNVYVDYTGSVRIGDRVELSGGVMVISHSHDVLDKQSKKIEVETLHIADGAWICVNALIMPGTQYVGKNSIVCAGSVVYKKVPDYAIVRGNPAKIVGVVPPEIRSRRKA